MQLSTGRARKPSHVARDRIATSVALRVVHDLNRSNGRCRLTIAFYGVDIEAQVISLPTTAPIPAHLIIMGSLVFEKRTGNHFAGRSQAMTRARVVEGYIDFSRNKSFQNASPEGRGEGVVRVMYSRKCQGSGIAIESPRLRLWRRISKSSSIETRTGGGNAHAQSENIGNLFGWTTVVTQKR